MNAQHLFAVTLSLLVPAVASAEKPNGVTPGLRVDNGVPPAVRKRFNQKLRTALEAHVALQDAGASEKSLATAGYTVQSCTDSACFEKVAAAAKSRFVITGEVTNADEIYRVTLTVWDSATDTVKDASRDCELCATEEVEKSIAEVVAAVQPEFARPAPAATPIAAPKPPPTVETTLVSDPPGAAVLVDGKSVGQTPVKLALTRGEHEIKLEKTGFLPETKKFTVGDRPATQEFLLQLDAKAAEAAAAAAPGAAPAAVEPAGGGSSHRGLGIGLAVGGAVGLGIGGYLIHLEGQVTCTDGRGRDECPTVYTTKWPAAAALVVGAAALGGGVTLLLNDDGGAPTTAGLAPTEGGAQALFSTPF